MVGCLGREYWDRTLFARCYDHWLFGCQRVLDTRLSSFDVTAVATFIETALHIMGNHG